MAGGQTFELSVPFQGYAFKTGDTIRNLSTLRKGHACRASENFVTIERRGAEKGTQRTKIECK